MNPPLPSPPAAADAIRGRVGSAQPHDSAHLHVAGAAPYTDDLPEPRGTLHAALGLSTQAHARIRALQLDAVRAQPDVVCVLTAADIPGDNDFAATPAHDDPLLAADEVNYCGQPLFLVVARSRDAARRAARLAVVDYEPLPALLDIDAALAAGSFVLPSETMQRGDAAAAIAAAPHVLNRRFYIGGQEQFYLEGMIALAIPREDGCMQVLSSTQHPSEVQHKVAQALGVHAKDVSVECRRMGGGFGGKESQPALFAGLAAIAARHCRQPVKLRPDRDDDFLITGKRHDFRVDYRVGFDASGRVLGLELELASRCGYSADLSGAINDRAMMHADNAYWLPAVRVRSHRCRTHTQSNTAFRGFGGPQGMLAIEQTLDDIARYLQLDALAVRRANLYGIGERDITPYGMRVEDNILPALLDELAASADYAGRRAAVDAFNAASPWLKRGLALTPVKFGISFTATWLNQAGALLLLYSDGTLQLNHGGTEMGQGLYTKVAQVVASELCVDIERIRVTAADTGKVPNASATAASSGADLNGKAAQDAARQLKARLCAFAARHWQVAESEVEFRRNRVRVGPQEIAFAELAHAAWFARVPLAAQGFYATPKIHYDRSRWQGRPFYYFACGAALSEVEIDTLTGEYRLCRVDILHDVGRSLNPAIDRGQIEGGFVQGMGWLTSEQLVHAADGSLRTHSPSTYKIPTCRDWPREFNVAIRASRGNSEDTVFRSKAVGEPPLMLAISVFLALKDAIGAAAPGVAVPLSAPATPEAVLTALDAVRASPP
ncbi:xanthine dehydrogenase molybdopterin binding subunit [Plasticicumulans acidivorans]|uniref:Xanthine dehydrogenase molybdenum binding subunit apoprotein n=1 Tax=Plasticicumulans acidivorans TaxID=886464 RepID=A0A317MZD0_9GAMM|nr:xanthine dehydrogenase molybdopterin binding subunit [Plasticicumulans acidivorans]PWV64456.1 xanthine dehydrogenase molybdenum binding subunit apoprotein [Plasticicumulans acidivorans]